MGHIVMRRCEGYGFQAVYSRIGYINQSLWVQNRVSFFRKLISWLKILSRLGKQLLQDRGGFGEFTLVQGIKIQLNQLWYRLRVPGSQRHIPTQKFLKYPPSQGLAEPGSQLTSALNRNKLQVSKKTPSFSQNITFSGQRQTQALYFTW